MNQFDRMSDGELAAAFAMEQSREAFDVLLHRHGGLVFRVCRRLTHNHHDAEDAMQAVFVALADRAACLTGEGSLAGWLYGTAWHVASRINRARMTRARYERQVNPTSGLEPSGSAMAEDDRRELYRAIHMLPPDYRDAVVLHHLEGMAVAEVAELTGWSIGTTASRLSRGRAMMRERLARRGVELPLAALGAILLGEAAMEVAAPPVTLPAAWAPPAAASTVGHLTAAGAGVGEVSAGGAVVGVNSAVKWAVAASVALSVGGGSVGGFRSVAEKPPKGQPRTLSAEVSTTVKAAFSGMVDDAEPALTPPPRATSRSTSIVPEPAGLSFLALGALALCRRRR